MKVSPSALWLIIHLLSWMQVAGFSAGFLAFARLALPVRGAVALALTPALDKYVVRPLIERGVVKEQGDQQE